MNKHKNHNKIKQINKNSKIIQSINSFSNHHRSYQSNELIGRNLNT